MQDILDTMHIYMGKADFAPLPSVDAAEEGKVEAGVQGVEASKGNSGGINAAITYDASASAVSHVVEAAGEGEEKEEDDDDDEAESMDVLGHPYWQKLQRVPRQTTALDTLFDTEEALSRTEDLEGESVSDVSECNK